MNDAPQQGPKDGSGDGPLPPDLRFLRVLVTVLTLTMIGGLVTIVALLVTRLPGRETPAPPLPDTLTLPAGSEAHAVTRGRGWVAVVVEGPAGDEILIYDAASGALRQRIRIAPATR